MDAIKIYVMTHKAFTMPPASDIYVPMQVGAALHEHLPYLTDDTGDQISAKNPHYCELTGLYWMWKNDHESEIVGLCHYRRYFINGYGEILDRPYIERILGQKDIIITPRMTFPPGEKTMADFYVEKHHKADLDCTRAAIQKLYPEYLADYDEVMNGNWEYFANMCICRKTLADAYAKWIFDILFEVEANLDISEYDDYNQRVFGFISERLLTVWVVHQKLKVWEQDVEEMTDRWAVLPQAMELAGKKNYAAALDFMSEKKAEIDGIERAGHDRNGQIKNLYALVQAAASEESPADARRRLLGEALKLYISRNYSLSYLDFMLKFAEEPLVDTVILGSNYGLHGINMKMLTTQVNVSMTFQDLSRDLELLEYLTAHISPGKIKKLVLILGEYALYDIAECSDIGKHIKGELYEPLLCPEYSKRQWNFLPDGLLDDEEKTAIQNACKQIFLTAGGFFNPKYAREDNCEEKYKGLDWSAADQQTRERYAKIRTADHNKLGKNQENTPVNLDRLSGIGKLCEKNGMELYVVIPPFTPEYEAYIAPAMKQELLEALEGLPYPLHFFDLNEEMWDGIFFAEDFFDMDHLNDAGAAKFTEILLGLLVS